MYTNSVGLISEQLKWYFAHKSKDKRTLTVRKNLADKILCVGLVRNTVNDEVNMRTSEKNLITSKRKMRKKMYVRRTEKMEPTHFVSSKLVFISNLGKT